MGDWPFCAREMTLVHHRFIRLAENTLTEKRRAGVPGAARSFTMRASGNGAQIDRAFRALGRRR